MTDKINPSHYHIGDIDTIDFLRAKLTAEEFRGFCKGNVIKYQSRAEHKGEPDSDYAKASWYGAWLEGRDPRPPKPEVPLAPEPVVADPAKFSADD